jgi:hypothetical protein
MEKLHDIEIRVCPVYLAKQKQMLYWLMDQNIEWTDEMREGMEGLLNLLDYIEDEIIFRGEE